MAKQKQFQYDTNHQLKSDERLRRMIEDGKPLPPFLKNEAERLRAAIEKGENGAHQPGK